jgi:hexokinase
VGTLVARSYGDRDCDVGVIIGTGTNACYVEELGNIKKLKGRCRKSGTMIINIEWGNFRALRATRYDKRLDLDSSNPGAQILEKMVSGMYLGELCRLIMADLIARNVLFGGRFSAGFNRKMCIKGEFVSSVLADVSHGLAGIRALLRSSGARDSSPEDRMIVKRICELISIRAARISAAAIVAVVTKMDPGIKRRHTVAIDGSVYEKVPGFPEKIKMAVDGLSGRSSGKVKIMLTKDGSGRGAAIMAAVAARVDAR